MHLMMLMPVFRMIFALRVRSMHAFIAKTTENRLHAAPHVAILTFRQESLTPPPFVKRGKNLHRTFVTAPGAFGLTGDGVRLAPGVVAALAAFRVAVQVVLLLGHGQRTFPMYSHTFGDSRRCRMCTHMHGLTGPAEFIIATIFGTLAIDQAIPTQRLLSTRKKDNPVSGSPTPQSKRLTQSPFVFRKVN